MRSIFSSVIMLVCSLMLAQNALAADSTGLISVLRATTVSSANVESQNGVILFQLNTGTNPAVSSNCSWLSVNKDSSFFASTLLSAQARGKSVRVWYDDVVVSGGLCLASTVQVTE